MAANPMHQFQVYKLGPEIKLGNVDLSFTNASLFMLISALTICLFLFPFPCSEGKGKSISSGHFLYTDGHVCPGHCQHCANGHHHWIHQSVSQLRRLHTHHSVHQSIMGAHCCCCTWSSAPSCCRRCCGCCCPSRCRP